MGMKDWLKKAKDAAQEKLNPQPLDPEAAEQKKRDDAMKSMQRTAKALELAQKGMQTYKTVTEKTGKVTREIADKASVVTDAVTDMAKPLVDKTAEAISDAGSKTKVALDQLGEKAVDAFDAVKDKVAGDKKPSAEKEEKVKKPSTGSALLDMIAPPIPETDNTKKDQPKP